jgi:hypothetical protein
MKMPGPAIKTTEQSDCWQVSITELSTMRDNLKYVSFGVTSAINECTPQLFFVFFLFLF